MREKVFVRGESYGGPVQAVIFDLAGTTLDHGCRGPVAVFLNAFGRFGIEPTIAETREPMGREKREHVAAMLAMPRINELWLQKYGKKPDEKDVDAVFASVLELMPRTLADYSEPVPGCLEALDWLRASKIKVGACTGYSRGMMSELLPRAKAAGFVPDSLVAADEVPSGRPWPWMCWRNCEKLGVFPPEAVIKAGDTIADIQEGLNAGHWSIAVTRTSNSLGLTAEQAASMDQELLERKEAELAETFKKAGAHYVISTLEELPRICGLIEERLTNGEKP